MTAGVHGAEYANIDAAYRVADTDPASLTGTLVVLPIVNPAAFWARSIYVNPVDGRNLNRFFPGTSDGSYTERLAAWLHETFLSRADALIDLHGGDLVEALEPFSIYTRGHAASRDLALAFGLPHLLSSDGRGMSFEVARSHGPPAIIAEAGGQGLRGEAAVTSLVEGTRRAMQHLGLLHGENDDVPIREYETFAWLSSPGCGLWTPSVTAGETVHEGQTVGVLRDLTGRTLHTAAAPGSGVVLFVVSSLAMNADDPLVGIGVPNAART